MYATTKELGAIKGISEQKVTKLKEIGGCCGSWVLGTAAPPVAPAVPD
jgi:hypothetical protein